MTIQVEAVFKGKPYSMACELWDIIASVHTHELGEVEVKDGFNGKSMSFRDVSRYLSSARADSFFIELLGGSIEYSYVADLDFSRLDIKNIASSKNEAESWVSPIIGEPHFVQARLYDREYDLWQNMEDISFYESEGRDYSQLVTSSNGLPFPLEAEVIDISENPGRWTLKHGYIESIGSTMWVSKDLLTTLGVDIATVVNCGFLEVADLGKVLKVEALDNCFISAGHGEAELQNKLRSLLFNQ